MSIYEIVKQDIKMPEGMLYRGKYCGKSKLREKANEFGPTKSEASYSTARSNARRLVKSVAPTTEKRTKKIKQ